MIKEHHCSITGDTFFTLQGVIAQDSESADGKLYEAVRKFSYQGSKIGLNIRLMVPLEVFGKSRIRKIDVVCFDPIQQKEVLKQKLGNGQKVEVLTRKTDKGLILDFADDIAKIEAI